MKHLLSSTFTTPPDFVNLKALESRLVNILPNLSRSKYIKSPPVLSSNFREIFFCSERGLNFMVVYWINSSRLPLARLSRSPFISILRKSSNWLTSCNKSPAFLLTSLSWVRVSVSVVRRSILPTGVIIKVSKVRNSWLILVKKRYFISSNSLYFSFSMRLRFCSIFHLTPKIIKAMNAKRYKSLAHQVAQSGANTSISKVADCLLHTLSRPAE